MAVPKVLNSESTTPLTPQKTVGMILPADATVLNFFCDETPLTLSCSQPRNDEPNFHFP
jgi:hypothetical protein